MHPIQFKKPLHTALVFKTSFILQTTHFEITTSHIMMYNRSYRKRKASDHVLTLNITSHLKVEDM